MKTHIKLLTTIIVMVAIIALAICLGMHQFKNNDLKNISTNLLQIQAKAKNIKEKTIVEDNENLLIGQEVPEDLLQKFNLEYSESIKLLTVEDLAMLGLSNIDEDRKYIVNYDNGEVYYIDGFKTEEGETYYKLSDMNAISTDNE